MAKVKLVQSIEVDEYGRVGLRIVDRKSILNGRMMWFTDHRNGTYTVEVQGSTQTLRIKQVHGNAKYVKGRDGERIKVTSKDKWVAIERSHWTGAVQNLGVVAFGRTAEQAFSNAFPLVWGM